MCNIIIFIFNFIDNWKDTLSVPTMTRHLAAKRPGMGGKLEVPLGLVKCSARAAAMQTLMFLIFGVFCFYFFVTFVHSRVRFFEKKNIAEYTAAHAIVNVCGRSLAPPGCLSYLPPQAGRVVILGFSRGPFHAFVFFMQLFIFVLYC